MARHAVVSLVAIDVEGPAPRALLQTPVAQLFRYRQLNLRTYVEGPQGPGMTLLETRIDRLTYALGARLAGMPYHLDRQLTYEVRPSLSCARATWRRRVIADAAGAGTGSLEHFACERYRAYAQLPVGDAVRPDRAPPWRARPVALQGPLTPAALGLASTRSRLGAAVRGGRGGGRASGAAGRGQEGPRSSPAWQRFRA